MTVRPCSIWIVLLSVLFTSLSWAENLGERVVAPVGAIGIEADRVIYRREQNLYEARGDVEIKMGDVRLRADEVDFFADTGVAEARGHVELTDGIDVLRCDRMRVNLKTQKGVVEEARLVTRENFHITAEKVEKLGPRTYRIHNGTFTTCGGERPDWSFKAKRVDVTLERYAVGRHAFFRVKNLPVFYLPIGVYPLETNRQTGFLIPRFGYSSRFGTRISLPFYWAISQDKDATFYFDWLGDRGFQQGAEFRYALAKKAKGQANFYFLDDKVKEENRWAFFLRHDQPHLPLDFYAKANINLVSDNDYPYDFQENFPGGYIARAPIDFRTTRQLKSNVFGGRRWPEYNLVGEFAYFDDLAVEDNSRTLQLLPEVTLAAFDQPLWNTPLYVGGDLSYTYFWREEGEKVSRLDLFPQVSLPIRPFGWLKFLPVAGLRETLYWPENDQQEEKGFASRTLLPTFEATLLTTISRVFDAGSWGMEKIKHRIRPFVRYTYVPPVDQGDLPDFDEKDQIPYTNLITYGLTNFVDTRKDRSPDSEIRRLLKLELLQSYSLGDPLVSEADSPEDRFSNIMGRLWFSPGSYFDLQTSAQYSLWEDRIVRFNTLALLSDSRGDSMRLEYQFSKDELEQINLFSRVRLWEPIDLFGSYRYDLLNNMRTETEGGLTYRSQCWNVTFSVLDIGASADGTKEEEVRYRLLISLVGLGAVGRLF
ncbi:MAG: LPS-assembly protein LptD [Deltaproteobacteria bacterium]|nr:LPS-assembly protein LptD [Deltaproteobacteria bacterium]MBW2122382.1 LPS-assembly protein LptD [Deltaproteobacteria bacterium]